MRKQCARFHFFIYFLIKTSLIAKEKAKKISELEKFIRKVLINKKIYVCLSKRLTVYTYLF